MNIGIFGGTFNPVHLGHLLLAQSALEVCALDRVWFMPCAVPPHKSAEGLASAPDRLAMVRAAIRGHPHFRVSRLELRRGGISYAVETFAALHETYPGQRWFFLAGMDSLLDLHRWREAERLLKLCTFVTLLRPGIASPSDPATLQLPLAPARALLKQIVPGRSLDLSSREIRERVASGRAIRYLVPDAVAECIRQRRLYIH